VTICPPVHLSEYFDLYCASDLAHIDRCRMYALEQKVVKFKWTCNDGSTH
jgi:hypothetical protein